jgi:hypothetical protein
VDDAAGRPRAQARGGGSGRSGDPQVHHFHLLLGPVAEAVPVQLLVRVRGTRPPPVGQRVEKPSSQATVPRRPAEVAQVGGCGRTLLSGRSLGASAAVPSLHTASASHRRDIQQRVPRDVRLYDGRPCTSTVSSPNAGQVARVAGHHATGDADDVDRAAQQQRPEPRTW